MNQLLQQVGALIKQKKNGDIFDLKSLINWNPSVDRELNKLILDCQICGIVFIDGSKGFQQYKATYSSMHANFKLDDSMQRAADEMLKQSENYQDYTGYSQELKKFCERISKLINDIIDEQNRFMGFNQEIMLALLKNSGFCLDIITWTTVRLEAYPTVASLMKVQDSCFERLLQN